MAIERSIRGQGEAAVQRRHLQSNIRHITQVIVIEAKSDTNYLDIILSITCSSVTPTLDKWRYRATF